MKNYLKFMVAIFGITIAVFGSISKSSAKIANVTCVGKTGVCGWTAEPECSTIVGTATDTPN